METDQLTQVYSEILTGDMQSTGGPTGPQGHSTSTPLLPGAAIQATLDSPHGTITCEILVPDGREGQTCRYRISVIGPDDCLVLKEGSFPPPMEDEDGEGDTTPVGWTAWGGAGSVKGETP